jgi:hypothetical protein
MPFIGLTIMWLFTTARRPTFTGSYVIDRFSTYFDPTENLKGHFILWHRYFVATYEKALRNECGYEGGQP